MAHSIEITSIDNKIPLLLQTEKDKGEEGRKVDHLIEIKETNGQDLLGCQKNTSINQIFKERFENLDDPSIELTTIFKVTAGLSESNPDAYKPKLISIGPYHRHNPELDSMKKYKLRYLQRFLNRKKGMDVASCISEMDKIKDDALKCYDDIGDVDNNILVNFSEMLLLDGCFVVEYIREFCTMSTQGEAMIIKGDCIHNLVNRDLLLVENQLPFFVLTTLHDMTNEEKISLTEFVKYFFLAKLWRKTPGISQVCEPNKKDYKHLLQAIHMSYSEMESLFWNPRMGAEISSKSQQTWHKVMPNATELSEAGIKFEKLGEIDNTSYMRDYFWDGRDLFDIQFEREVMKIPCFEIADDTETFLRNLIAYEQQSSEVHTKYFTDFAIFMDYLIDSEKDVSLLRQKGIINNRIGEDKEVASFFNKIGKWVAISDDDFYYKEECRKVVQHCERPWNKTKQNLRHNYFNSPWAGISTVAAIILLLLTVTQTVLSFISTLKN